MTEDELRVLGADLERELREMIRSESGGLELSFNSHRVDHLTTAEHLAQDDCNEWVSEEQKQKALEKNSVWELRWYPWGSTSWSQVAAADLPELFAYLERAR